MGLFTKLFGSYSDRELKKINPIADAIEALEPKFAAMSDAQAAMKIAAQTRCRRRTIPTIAFAFISPNPSNDCISAE